MLTTPEAVTAVPGLINPANVPLAWLNQLIGAADRAIKRYLKRDIEQQAYVEYYDGHDMPDVVLANYPVLCGSTQIAAGSNGAVLPQSTINVVSTKGFEAGTGNNPNAELPQIGIQTGAGTYTAVSYTGTTATSFTGCTGGVGILSSLNGLNLVYSPIVWQDPSSYAGLVPTTQNTQPFGPTTQMALGVSYIPQLDRRGKVSNRGLLTRIGGPMSGFIGFYPGEYGGSGGKLGASRKPCWPRGTRNIKVAYAAGYRPVPADIQYAATMLIAKMIRIQPMGSPLSSESLGGYSYNIANASLDSPELGDIGRTLAYYREIAW